MKLQLILPGSLPARLRRRRNCHTKLAEEWFSILCSRVDVTLPKNSKETERRSDNRAFLYLNALLLDDMHRRH